MITVDICLILVLGTTITTQTLLLHDSWRAKGPPINDRGPWDFRLGRALGVDDWWRSKEVESTKDRGLSSVVHDVQPIQVVVS